MGTAIAEHRLHCSLVNMRPRRSIYTAAENPVSAFHAHLDAPVISALQSVGFVSHSAML